MNKRCLVSAIVLSALATSVTTSVLAAESENVGNELKPVEVMASKVVKDKKGDRLAVPESSKTGTQTFTRQDIEAIHPRNIPDLIETALGMGVSSQGERIFSFIRGRGGDKGAIGIILDGVYLSTGAAQRILQDIPVAMVDSVEIVRDSTIATMGPLAGLSSSMGATYQGFVIINTKKATSNENEATISYGTYNTETIGIFHADKLNDKSYLNFEYQKSKSDGKTDWNNAYNADTFLLKSGYADKGFTADFSLYANRSSREIQGFQQANGVWNHMVWKYDPMDTTVLGINIAKEWDSHNKTAFSYGYSKQSGTLYPYNSDPNFSSNTTAAYLGGMPESEQINEYNLWHTIKNGNNTLKFGTQILDWDSLSEGKENNSRYASDGTRYTYMTLPGTKVKQEVYGYYVYDENRVTDRLTLDGGIRLDKKHISQGTTVNRVNVVGWVNDATSLSVGASYKLSPMYTLSSRVAYTTTPSDPITAPTWDNHTLADEHRMKYEFGIHAKYSEKINVSVTPFYYDIKNARIKDTINSGANTYYTSNNLARKGLELDVNGRLSETYSYDFGYTWYTSSLASEDITNPHRKLTARLGYKKDKIDANITVLSVSPYTSIPNGTSKGRQVGGFSTVNISIGKQLDAKTKVTLFGQNITNNHYTTTYKNDGFGYYYDIGAIYGIQLSKKF